MKHVKVQLLWGPQAEGAARLCGSGRPVARVQLVQGTSAGPGVREQRDRGENPRRLLRPWGEPRNMAMSWPPM